LGEKARVQNISINYVKTIKLNDLKLILERLKKVYNIFIKYIVVDFHKMYNLMKKLFYYVSHKLHNHFKYLID